MYNPTEKVAGSVNYTRSRIDIPARSEMHMPAKNAGSRVWMYIKETPFVIIALIASVLFFIVERKGR